MLPGIRIDDRGHRSKEGSAVTRRSLKLSGRRRYLLMLSLLLPARHGRPGVVTRSDWHDRAVIVDGVDAVLQVLLHRAGRVAQNRVPVHLQLVAGGPHK